MRWAAAGLTPGFAAGVAPPAPARFVGSAAANSTETAPWRARGLHRPTWSLVTGLVPDVGALPMRGDAPAAAGLTPAGLTPAGLTPAGLTPDPASHPPRVRAGAPTALPPRPARMKIPLNFRPRHPNHPP
jgi:hypothetical protein